MGRHTKHKRKPHLCATCGEDHPEMFCTAIASRNANAVRAPITCPVSRSAPRCRHATARHEAAQAERLDAGRDCRRRKVWFDRSAVSRGVEGRMSDLPNGVELVEIDDKDYCWKPCDLRQMPMVVEGRHERRPEVRMCFQCDPPTGVAFRLLELMHRSKGSRWRWKPYYEDAASGITIYHGDCLDVMASMPDGSVDAIWTDPPYSHGTPTAICCRAAL